MKNILVLGFILTLISTAGISQQLRGGNIQNFQIERGFKNGQLNRPEKMQLRKDQFRFKMERHRALKDGRVTPEERRKLTMLKRKNNLNIYRLKHNRKHRVI